MILLCMLDAPTLDTRSAPSAPNLSDALGSPVFSERLLQDCLVEAQVGDQLLQLPVLFAQLPKLTDLGRAHAAELLLPPIKGLLGDLELPTDLNDRSPALSLPERHCYLLRREFARPHRAVLRLIPEASGQL